MLQNAQMFLLSEIGKKKKSTSSLTYFCFCFFYTALHPIFADALYLALSSALEKKPNRVLWCPSACMQQPCTSVRTTLLTRTRLIDLEEELNRRQYTSRRSVAHDT